MTTEQHHPDEAFVGKQLEPRSIEISKKTVDDYFEGLKVDRAAYENISQDKDLVTPSMVIIDAESISGASFRNNFGNLWMRQEVDFHAPLPTEESLDVRSRVLDIYEWRNRTIVLQESEIFNQNEELLGVCFSRLVLGLWWLAEVETGTAIEPDLSLIHI